VPSPNIKVAFFEAGAGAGLGAGIGGIDGVAIVGDVTGAEIGAEVGVSRAVGGASEERFAERGDSEAISERPAAIVASTSTFPRFIAASVTMLTDTSPTSE
jgi:hypothetical protein